jgi:hypothetical protein
VLSELTDFVDYRSKVYTPCVSSYGSCPATLDVSPGTKVSVYITFLTKPLAAAMHKTEWVQAYSVLPCIL